MTFEKEFDAVFSNAELHWMKGADRVVRNITRALRHQGRFVAEMGGYKCVETIRGALVEELNGHNRSGVGFDVSYIETDSEADSDPRHNGSGSPRSLMLHGALACR